MVSGCKFRTWRSAREGDMDPSRLRLTHHRPKSGVNWPLWIILAVFMVGVIGLLASSGPRTVRRTRSGGDALRGRVAPSGDALVVGGCYGLSRDTPLCEGCGKVYLEGETTKRIVLPAGTQIGVVGVREADKSKWYRVQAVASDGRTDLGTGWISSASLKDQHLKMLR